MKPKNKKTSYEDVKKMFVKYPEVGRIYQHYKGGKYEVLTLAKHSETNEDLVVYKSIQFGSVHARPLKMWFDKISDSHYEEEIIRRFTLIK